MIYYIWGLGITFILLLGLCIYNTIKHPCIKYDEQITCNTTMFFNPATKAVMPQTICSKKCLERE